MSAPQAVRIGDQIYVGGGYRNPGASKAVLRYDTMKDAWSPLPSCPTLQHGLATLNSKLVALGGTLSASGKKTNTVLTFEGGLWQALLPPMPTPRSLLSTSSYENRLIIAAGGITDTKSDGKSSRTDMVEIFIKDRQWYRTLHLPFPGYTFSTSTIGDTCYILGGVANPHQSRTTLHTTHSALLKNAEVAECDYVTLKTASTWKPLGGRHPLPSATLVQVDGKLLALGGEKWTARGIQGSVFISAYDFSAGMWVECKGAQLPSALYRPGVVKLDHDEVMVIGGESKTQQFSTHVSIGEPLGMVQVNHYTL